MTNLIINVDDINELRDRIRAWGKGNRDKSLTKAYAKDRQDLGRIIDAIEDGNLKRAQRIAISLDTIVRDQIPNILWYKLHEGEGLSEKATRRVELEIARRARKTGEEADPNADEFKCENCRKVTDIENSCRDSRTKKLYCVTCADAPVIMRVPSEYRE